MLELGTSTSRNDHVEPARKSLEVRGEPVRAVRCFTGEIAPWCPLESHCPGGADAATCLMEEGVGGRLLKRARSGAETPWGRLTAWQPPRRLGFTFHPGRPVEAATRVTVSFIEAAGERTHVALVHAGWRALGERAAALRETHHRGRDLVFQERFGPQANRP